MSGGEPFDLVVAGFTAPVVRPDAAADSAGREGVGFSAVIRDGIPHLALTVLHSDGGLLTVFLDEDRINQLAEPMADFVEALTPPASEARH